MANLTLQTVQFPGLDDTYVIPPLATVETSTTASQAYSEGEYFVLNGVLYKVTADIESGGTITIGTNCEATTVATELTDAITTTDIDSLF